MIQVFNSLIFMHIVLYFCFYISLDFQIKFYFINLIEILLTLFPCLIQDKIKLNFYQLIFSFFSFLIKNIPSILNTFQTISNINIFLQSSIITYFSNLFHH